MAKKIETQKVRKKYIHIYRERGGEGERESVSQSVSQSINKPVHHCLSVLGMMPASKHILRQKDLLRRIIWVENEKNRIQS